MDLVRDAAASPSRIAGAARLGYPKLYGLHRPAAGNGMEFGDCDISATSAQPPEPGGHASARDQTTRSRTAAEMRAMRPQIIRSEPKRISVQRIPSGNWDDSGAVPRTKTAR